MLLRTIIVLFTFTIYNCVCFEVPCTEKLVAGECTVDEECYGPNTVCLNGRCACPTNFEAFNTTGSTNRVYCRPAPSNLNDECQTDCKPPLTCRDNKCDCWGSGSEIKNGVCTIKCPSGTEQYGSECRKVSHLNQACKEDLDCVDPFTECNRICRCVSGTSNFWGKCKPNCPDGQPPKGSCRRLFTNDVDMIEHKANGDTCPDDHYCATYGKPNVGHCCKIYCPYGEPDLSKSCDATETGGGSCRQLTHFCHKIKAPGYSKSICCPRPCREPTPLFLNGKCMSNAHLDDLCSIDEQCEGGVNMLCDKPSSRCRCRDGFVSFTGGRFASCRKACAAGEVEVAGRCVARVNLGARCYSNNQCPQCARCYNGVCECKCGYVPRQVLGVTACSNPSKSSSGGGGGGFDFGSIFAQLAGGAGGGSSGGGCDA